MFIEKIPASLLIIDKLKEFSPSPTTRNLETDVSSPSPDEIKQDNAIHNHHASRRVVREKVEKEINERQSSHPKILLVGDCGIPAAAGVRSQPQRTCTYVGKVNMIEQSKIEANQISL